MLGVAHSKGCHGSLLVLWLPCGWGGRIDRGGSGKTIQWSENGRSCELPIPRPCSERVSGHRIVPCIRSVHKVEQFSVLASCKHLLTLAPFRPPILKPHLTEEK